MMKQQSAAVRRQHQYEFNWAEASAKMSAPPTVPALSSGQSTPALATLTLVAPEPDAPPPAPAAITVPWDFKTTFPSPLEQAVEAGLLCEEDASLEAIRSIHEEHAAEYLTILSDLDALEAARADGVDPRTRKKPRTEKAQQRLEQYLSTAPAALARKLSELLDVYENAFGQEAAAAFQTVLHAWHRGMSVVAEASGQSPAATAEQVGAHALPTPTTPDQSEHLDRLGGPALPVPKPLDDAINRGAFGHDENGDPVVPDEEEVEAITLHHADRLMDLLDKLRDADAALTRTSDERREALYRAKDRAWSAYESTLQLYAEDFGEAASQRLDAWVHYQVETDRGEVQYDPSHPWHYLARGDNHEPMPADEIPPAPVDGSLVAAKLPKDRAKREKKLRAMKAEQRSRLEANRQRYVQLVDMGAAALNDFDRSIAYAGDEELAWASAVALAYTHIRQGLGRLAWIEQRLASLLGTAEVAAATSASS